MKLDRLSNVTLTDIRNGKSATVFVDCVQMQGVRSARYSVDGADSLPILTLEVYMPALARKPTVRRKCLTRPHVPV